MEAALKILIMITILTLSPILFAKEIDPDLLGSKKSLENFDEGKQYIQLGVSEVLEAGRDYTETLNAIQTSLRSTDTQNDYSEFAEVEDKYKKFREMLYLLDQEIEIFDIFLRVRQRHGQCIGTSSGKSSRAAQSLCQIYHEMSVELSQLSLSRGSLLDILLSKIAEIKDIHEFVQEAGAEGIGEMYNRDAAIISTHAAELNSKISQFENAVLGFESLKPQQHRQSFLKFDESVIANEAHSSI